jgi:hypothetical protein
LQLYLESPKLTRVHRQVGWEPVSNNWGADISSFSQGTQLAASETAPGDWLNFNDDTINDEEGTAVEKDGSRYQSLGDGASSSGRMTMKAKNKKKKGRKAEPVVTGWDEAIAQNQDDKASNQTDAQWGDIPSDLVSGW